MTRLKKGFTLIEVALFLVITGALFVSVTIGVQNSITQQRINDSVQNFAEFLRTVYSGVLNVENLPGRGNSEKAIYGKLVTFGEQVSETDSDKNNIFVYTVVGQADSGVSGSILTLLNNLQINVIEKDGDEIKPYGIVESYKPRWSSTIEVPCNGSNCSFTPYIGALLVVRHPSSGTVYTFVMSGQTIQVNNYINSIGSTIEGTSIGNLFQNGDINYLSSDYFKIQDVDFCVNPFGEENTMNRRDVRIIAGARNASGIELVASDSGLSHAQGGNRCQPQ